MGVVLVPGLIKQGDPITIDPSPALFVPLRPV
jgi:MOSC domain-containing protein YiiM